MRLHVQLYAAAKEVAGASAVTVTLPESATVSELRAELISAVPALINLRDSLLISVDQLYASDHQQLNQTSEVACFPPVSGG